MPEIYFHANHRWNRHRYGLLQRQAQQATMDALKVLTLTPTIRAWLEANDPKALAQADAARQWLRRQHGNT